MKKIFFLALPLLIAAVSCSKSEMIEAPNSQLEISFDSYIGKAPETKGQSVDLSYLQTTGRGFHVKGFFHQAEEGQAVSKPTIAAEASPYMDKAVYWVADNPASEKGIPSEIPGQTKVIFSEAVEAPTAPSIAGTTYESFVCPADWFDFPTGEATYYVVCTFSNNAWPSGPVTKISEFTNVSGHWDYDGVVYWPDASSKNYLAFTAYGVHSVSQSTDNGKTVTTAIAPDCITNVQSNSFDFAVRDAVADQQDLIVAPFQWGKKINATNSNTTVTFNFKHVLSRVGFKVKANNTNDTDVIITKVDLAGKFLTSGNVDLTLDTPKIGLNGTSNEKTYSLLPATDTTKGYGFTCTSSIEEKPIFVNAAWTKAADAKIYTMTALSDADGNFKDAVTNEANRFMMLMPTNETSAADAEAKTYEDGNYVITVDYQLEGTKKYYTATVNLPDTFTFLPGKSYEFLFKVSTTSIGFSVTVADWADYFPEKDENGAPITGVEGGEFTLTPIVKEN